MKRGDETAIRWPVVGGLVGAMTFFVLGGVAMLPLLAVILPFYWPMFWLVEKSR